MPPWPMLLQLCHMSLWSVVNPVDVLNRKADIWLAWLLLSLVTIKQAKNVELQTMYHSCLTSIVMSKLYR